MPHVYSPFAAPQVYSILWDIVRDLTCKRRVTGSFRRTLASSCPPSSKSSVSLFLQRLISWQVLCNHFRDSDHSRGAACCSSISSPPVTVSPRPFRKRATYCFAYSYHLPHSFLTAWQ